MVRFAEKGLLLLITVLITFSTIILIDLETVNFNHYGKINYPDELQLKISQDLIRPNITFIEPSTNNSIIEVKSYEIIVNITDENPPTPGNVSIEISNYTTALFSAPMNYSGDNLWNFIWNNVSDYESYLICVIHIWAKDSSPNENVSWSDPWYVIIIINEPIGTNIFLSIIYIIVVVFMFALAIVILNKRVLHKTLRKK